MVKINILCSGHGSAQLGCGYDFDVERIEVSDAIYAICPNCGARTDLAKTFETPSALDQLFESFGKIRVNSV